MIKRVVLVLLLSLISLGNIFSVDKSEVWSRLYKRSQTVEQKYMVMMKLSERPDPDLADFYKDILMEDIIANLNNHRSVNDEKHFIGLTKLVLSQLGELKVKESADIIFQVYQGHDDPLVKSEALMALGNMLATEYADNIAYILHLKNNRPREGAYSSNDLDSENRVAFAAISALDRFRSEVGYEAVFLATDGWYNDRVTNYANKVLLTIVDDPTQSLIKILREDDFKNKEKAMGEVIRSRAPGDNKNLASNIALYEGHRHVPGNIRDGVTLTTLRKRAIYSLWDNESGNPEDVEFLIKSMTHGSDLEEKVMAVRALGTNGSNEALDALINRLREYNYKSVLGMDLSYMDQDVIREIIITLGTRGDNRAEFALLEVLFSDYASGITRVAENSLEMLNS